MFFFDTETCGLHGPIVLLQYARDMEPVKMHSVWTEPIETTLAIIEGFLQEPDGVCAFNLAFDWFHICQLYTTLILFPDWSVLPINHIDEYASYEKEARDGPCLKPKAALDLMLHARKGPYQSTMDRNDIKIRRVPTKLASELVNELDKRIKLKKVYFARKKNPSQHWHILDIKDDFDMVIPEFKDIVLKFAPSSALKALAEDALGIEPDDILKFVDVEVDPKLRPKEYGYAPFAEAVGTPDNWNWAWPQVIHQHIEHWGFNKFARKYAADDVIYIQKLYNFFGKPDHSDTDSILACMVGAVRWKGYKLNLEALTVLREKAKAKTLTRINFRSIPVCRKYLEQVLAETERAVLLVNNKMTTKGIILEEIAKWMIQNVCDEPDCMGMGCEKCDDGLISTGEKHPAAIRASEILEFRRALKEIELYDKLLHAGRFHASFKVIGTLSSRMAGADSLNAQGIKRSKEVRSCFLLANEDTSLCGGDFDGFEVSIMDAVYADPKLRNLLQSKRTCHKCQGAGCGECGNTGVQDTKIHALFGTKLFPPMTYNEIMETKGLPDELDKYSRSKNGVFAIFYGGNEETLRTRVGVDVEVALRAMEEWIQDFPVWGKNRQRVFDMFCSMRQPGGIGTKVEWHDPAGFVESMYGFRRYFTLENMICKTLFDLAQDLPPAWKDIPLKVVRRDREQTLAGAICSALYAGAFQVQASNMRAAANHEIQSPGGQLTKELEAVIWTLQPAGINEWVVQPMNVHDEVMSVNDPKVNDQCTKLVDAFIKEGKAKIPLLGMTWKSDLKDWGSK